MEIDTVKRDIAVDQLFLVSPNATSFCSNTDLQGRPSLPFHPIGSLELTNLAPSALPFVADAGSGPCFWVSSVPPSRGAVPGSFFSPSTLHLLRLSISRPIEPLSTFCNSKIKCLHEKESRRKRRRSCRLCLVTKVRKKRSKTLFLTSFAALCVRVVN